MTKSRYVRVVADGPQSDEHSPRYNVVIQRGHHGNMGQPHEKKGVTLSSLRRLLKIRKSHVVVNP